jgi:hypothetical protein
MHFLNATLRKEITEALAKCAIAGCDELPTMRLPDPMQVRDLVWCEGHGMWAARTIASRDYRDFVGALRQMGVKQPALTDPRFGLPEERRCCVQGCEGKVVSGRDFAPYKEPGGAWVCEAHYPALNHVSKRLNGQRFVNELARERPARKLDPIDKRRKDAILELCAAHYGQPNYIRAVCEGLQKRKIKMPPRWVNEWNERYAWGLQQWDWFVAYQKPDAKHRIENFISRIARIRLRPGIR